MLAEAARVLQPGGLLVHIGVHPCFCGGFADRGDPQAVLVRPGYLDGHWTKASWTDQGVRDKVGATHMPLASLLHAFTNAGLVLERFAEGGEPTPTVLAIRARAAWRGVEQGRVITRSPAVRCRDRMAFLAWARHVPAWVSQMTSVRVIQPTRTRRATSSLPCSVPRSRHVFERQITRMALSWWSTTPCGRTNSDSDTPALLDLAVRSAHADDAPVAARADEC